MKALVVTLVMMAATAIAWAQQPSANQEKIACTQRAHDAAAGWGIKEPVVTSRTDDGADYYAAWANRFNSQTGSCLLRVTFQTFNPKTKELKRNVYIEDVDQTSDIVANLTEWPDLFECTVDGIQCKTTDEFYSLAREKYGF